MSDATTTVTEYRIDRADLRAITEVERPLSIGDGEVLARVEAFAFTANNVTYAAFGEEMAYWQFFPAEAGSGIIPVWGFAEVVRSRCPEIAVGERLYGYWPMASHLALAPGRITDHGFVDQTAHRAALPPVYNFYLRWSALARPDHEPTYMLFRPLFVLAFLLDDHLAEEGYFGAEAIIVTSASSKTALAFAECVGARTARPTLIALTSPGNADFVGRTGYYDSVIAYDDAATAVPSGPAMIADFAGDGALRAKLHDALGDRLVHDSVIGGTHWEERGDRAALPGPKPVFFFAPTQYAKRYKEWGAAKFEQALDGSWDRFVASTKPWLRFTDARGGAEIIAAYGAIIDGKTDPATGNIFRPV